MDINEFIGDEKWLSEENRPDLNDIKQAIGYIKQLQKELAHEIDMNAQGRAKIDIRGMIMNERQSLNNGIPDCPDCGGKGMCEKHLLELLQYEAITAMTAYRDALLKQVKKQERIAQNELSSS